MVSVVKYFTTSKVPVTYSKYVTQITLAYETYGELNTAKDNALLVIHGFSGSSHVAAHSANDSPGWWEWAVGPGKALDTNKYFIVCANNLGGCFGSTGATDISSPSIADIVFCQQKLQEELEIDRWHAVVGGSLGGMAVLEWIASYPEKVHQAVCLNAGAMLSFIGQGLMDIQEELIRSLPLDEGLHIARRLANISYVGENFFVQCQSGDINWRLSSFLKEEANSFIDSFDSISYLNFLYAMRTFNLNYHKAPLADCFFAPKVLLVGCAEDILFPMWIIEETKFRLSTFAEVDQKIVSSKFGHDAFLLDELLYTKLLRAYFASAK